jgi:hypothetical protein
MSILDRFDKFMRTEFVPFPKFVKNRIKTLFGRDQMGRPGVGVMSFRELYKKYKRDGKRNNVKHPRLKALGMTVRARILNGAELNILLLGVPVLIDLGYSYTVEGQFMKGGFKGRRKEKKRQMRLQLQQNNVNQPKLTNLEDLPPVPMSPYSDRALPLRDRLVSFGVSLDGANEFVSGRHEDEDITEFLSEEDIRIIAENFDDIFQPSDDNQNEEE